MCAAVAHVAPPQVLALYTYTGQLYEKHIRVHFDVEDRVWAVVDKDETEHCGAGSVLAGLTNGAEARTLHYTAPPPAPDRPTPRSTVLWLPCGLGMDEALRVAQCLPHPTVLEAWYAQAPQITPIFSEVIQKASEQKNQEELQPSLTETLKGLLVGPGQAYRSVCLRCGVVVVVVLDALVMGLCCVVLAVLAFLVAKVAVAVAFFWMQLLSWSCWRRLPAAV